MLYIKYFRNILFLILLLFTSNVSAQNFKKFNKANIECVQVQKDEETMASDNEMNRSTVCYGYSNDGTTRLRCIFTADTSIMSCGEE